MHTEKTHVVAHVTIVHTPIDNRIMRKECAALSNAGIDVCLIAVHRGEQLSIERVPIFSLPNRGGRARRMLLGPFDVWKALKTVRPSIIHVHDPELIPVSLLWRLGKNRQIVYDAHEDLPKQIMGKAYIPLPVRGMVARVARLLEIVADKGFDAIVAATPPIARNFSNKNVILVQNFPWIRDFPDEPTLDHGEPKRIAYVGAITRERCGYEMISATLASDNQPELVLAGPATAEMQVEIDANRARRVKYLGVLSADRVPGILRSSMAGLILLKPLPNYLESQPTKIYEYMAAGRPFIASNFDTWIKQLGGYRCGIFVDSANLTAISEAMDALMNNPVQAMEMGLRGRLAFKRTFNFELEATRLVEAVVLLLESSCRRSMPLVSATDTPQVRDSR